MITEIAVFFKAVLIGATMLVPGVSGGSMAMILGLYDRLMKAVGMFFKDKRKNFMFLLIFSLGAILGMILLSKPILHLLNLYNKPMMFFFIGAVAGGVPLIVEKSRAKKFGIWSFGYIALGIMCVILMKMLPTNMINVAFENYFISMFILIVMGIVAAVALILPGISISYVFLIFGMYDTTIEAIGNINLAYLIPLGFGLIIGIFLSSRMLEYAMEKHPHITYLIILGFIIGSVILVFPGIPMGIELFVSGMTFLLGFGAIEFCRRKLK